MNPQFVIDGLRTLRKDSHRKTDLTRLIHAMETAIRLRQPTAAIEETEHHERLASGYTLAQARMGGQNNAFKSNKHALLGNFRKALPALLNNEVDCTAFIHQLMEAVSTFGIGLQELKDILAEETMGEELVDGMTREERQLWGRGIAYIKRNTTLIEEQKL